MERIAFKTLPLKTWKGLQLQNIKISRAFL